MAEPSSPESLVHASRETNHSLKLHGSCTAVPVSSGCSWTHLLSKSCGEYQVTATLAEGFSSQQWHAMDDSLESAC